jgi:copper(I)-binding protein
MTRLIRRRGMLQTGVALGAALLWPRAHACEFFSTHLRIYEPWARATLDGAHTAVLCMTFDEVTQTDRLIGVETPVASGAELGGAQASRPLDLLILQGRDTELTETGTYIRLTGLRFALEVAREYPLTLVFERGGVVRADFDVKYGSATS